MSGSGEGLAAAVVSRRRRFRMLAAIALSQLLVLTLWFSASAVAPQLENAWGLNVGQEAGLTLAVQIGFVAGALVVAVLGLADVFASRRTFVTAPSVGLAANAAVVALGPGDYSRAFALRVLAGLALAGVYPTGLKVMAGWFKRGRGAALGLLVGALTSAALRPT